jgi:predicted alpha/beta-hydrolase family hydrolase
MDKKGSLVRRYQRKATLDNWVEALLIFAYPFYPVEGKREEIYSDSLHDIFRQIEAEKVLKKLN